jgi:hypothetical protein
MLSLYEQSNIAKTNWDEAKQNHDLNSPVLQGLWNTYEETKERFDKKKIEAIKAVGQTKVDELLAPAVPNLLEAGGRRKRKKQRRTGKRKIHRRKYKTRKL